MSGRAPRAPRATVLSLALPALLAPLIGPAGTPVSAAPDVVERRGAEPAVEGDLSGLARAGVVVTTPSGARVEIAWDRVRRITPRPTDPSYDDLLATATELWRARLRVERGDTRLAEPLLERLFADFRGQTHETARVVAEGLLRCRLARGANAMAVVPALETMRLERAGITTNSYGRPLEPVLDPDTTLCPHLAPAWLPARAVVMLERDLAAYDAQGDEVVATIAALYREAARLQLHADVADEGDAADADADSGDESGDESGAPGDTDARPDPAALADHEHPGVAALARVVGCAAAEAAARETARDRVVRELDDDPPWLEAWGRFAVGASLLREPGVGRRQRGMVQLVHLPARFRRTLPFLSGLALAWVIEATDRHGNAASAATLRDELARVYPGHPVHATARAITPLRAEDPNP